MNVVFLLLTSALIMHVASNTRHDTRSYVLLKRRRVSEIGSYNYRCDGSRAALTFKYPGALCKDMQSAQDLMGWASGTPLVVASPHVCGWEKTYTKQNWE